MKAESEIIESIVRCECMLFLLQQSIDQNETRKNEAIAHNIEFARQSVIHSVEKLAEGDLVQARTLIEIGILRAGFASRAFEAERIEALLGEADFLELYPQWQKEVLEILADLRISIDALSHTLASAKEIWHYP